MNGELISQLEYFEKEQGIERETMIKAIEEGIVAAALKRKDEATRELKVTIDRKSGQIQASVKLLVADPVVSKQSEIALSRARRIRPDAKIGDEIVVELDPRDFGRIAAQTAMQIIRQRQNLARKERIFVEFKDRVGEIVSGVVRRFERSDVYVDLGKFEARLPSRERVSTEEYQMGDRLRAYVLAVENDAHGPEIILSRSHPNFVRRLFELEVSEISDKTVEIKAIAREAGFRTKIAVASRDEKVDPVGACVGMRGVRVKNIVRELNGEKVDIIRWHADIREFAIEAMKPAKIKNMTVDETARKLVVFVDPADLSLAVGKRGQNARLTSRLLGWHVAIQKDETGEAAFEDKLSQAAGILGQQLGISQEVASALVHAGFSSVEAIQSAEPSDIAQIPGITLDQAKAIFDLAQRKGKETGDTSLVTTSAPATETPNT